MTHVMPDLPNVGWERDVEAFREFFESPEFRCGGVGLCTGFEWVVCGLRLCLCDCVYEST